MITLIAAVDEDWGIGKDNTIPWFLSRDMQSFQQETMGGAVIMGRKTWESLGQKPLVNRTNYVITSQHSIEGWDDLLQAYFTPNIERALLAIRNRGHLRSYVIGGTKMYEYFATRSDRMMLSRVPGKHDCDTFFPKPNFSLWKNPRKVDMGKFIIEEYMRK